MTKRIIINQPARVGNFWSNNSSKVNDEERVMHSKSDNKEIKINDYAGEVTEKLTELLLDRYQNNIET